MLCKNCDIEIDDKALICYRCGTATREPVHQPAVTTPPSGRRAIPMVLAAVFLLAAAFFGYQVWRGQEVAPAVWLMLAAAGVLLAIRLRFSR